VFSDGKKLSSATKATRHKEKFEKIAWCLGGNQFLTMFRSKLS